MNRNFFTCLLVLMSLGLLSTTSISQSTTEKKTYTGLLWKAEREHWTLYLYGVTHGSDVVIELNSQVRQLIESSNIYVSEIPLGKAVEHPTELKNIRREFIEKPFELNEAAELAFRKMHTEGAIGAYQYWALRHQSPITATRGVYAELLYKYYSDQQVTVTNFPKPRPGPDRLALNLANTRQINTVQIEPEHTADRYWLKNCDNERDNSAYLLSLIDIATKKRTRFQTLNEQILAGNLAGYQKIVDEDIEFDFLRLDYKCHVIDRNKFWANSLNRLTIIRETSLQPVKSVMFFTFGAAHAITPKDFPATSLIDFLMEQGWKIQSVEVKR